MLQRPSSALRASFRSTALAVALAAAAGLAACESTPQAPTYPDLSFSHMRAIELDVARIENSSRYIPPLKPPNVEHLSPVPPYQAVRRWGEQRLRAAGEENTARLVILDASIREVPLKTKGGLTGAFKREQAARFEGRLAVLLEIVEPRGRQLAFVTVRSERSHTIPEGATLAYREKVLFSLTEEMLSELNRGLEDGVRTHLQTYVKGG